MLKLLENKLELSPELISLLDAKPGDKISIEYNSVNEKLIPVILKSDSGNILTKSNTVAFKGKQHSTLIQFGDEFQVIANDNILELHGNKNNITYTSVKTDVKETMIDKNIIKDTNYNIQKRQTYDL